MINVVETIMNTFDGAVMARRGSSNFIAIPVGDDKEGIPTYYSVRVSKLANKDTEKTAAFNYDEAVVAYEAHQIEMADKKAAAAAERAANRPAKTKKVDEEKEAAKKARKDAVLAWLIENPGEHTATEIYDALPTVYADMMVMRTGNDLNSLLEDGEVSCRKEKSKKFWSFGN